MVPSLSLLSYESSVSVKENPDRKKNIRMLNFVLLKTFEKIGLFSLGLKYVIFDIVLKRRCKESFEDLEFNSN